MANTTHALLSFDGIILSVVEFVIPYLNISQTPLNYPILYGVMRNIAKVFNRFESVLILHVIQASLEHCSFSIDALNLRPFLVLQHNNRTEDAVYLPDYKFNGK